MSDYRLSAANAARSSKCMKSLASVWSTSHVQPPVDGNIGADQAFLGNGNDTFQ